MLNKTIFLGFVCTPWVRDVATSLTFKDCACEWHNFLSETTRNDDLLSVTLEQELFSFEIH